MPQVNSILQPVLRRPKLIVFLLLLSLSAGAVAIVSNPLQHGLLGYYYDNPDWTEPQILTVRDQAIDLYRKEVEFPSITTGYSIKWKGALYIPETGEYGFSLLADARAEIHVDDRHIMSHKPDENLHAQQTIVKLEKGFHMLKIWYSHGDGDAAFQISWQPPGREREPLPYRLLFIEKPTAYEFALGKCLDVLLLLSKWLAACTGLGAVLLMLRYCRSIVVNQGLMMLVIFLIVFSSHFWGSHISTSSDSMWTIATALSIIREKNIDLDEYLPLIREQQYYAVERVAQHLYSIYPVGTPLLSVPFVYALDRFLERGLAMDLGKVLREDYGTRGGLEVWIASIFVACSAVCLYAVSCLRMKRIVYSLILVFIFAFCTSAWSTASRALWQHTASILLLTLVLLVFVWAREHPASAPLMIRLASVLLAFSYVVRPTNSLSILVFTFYVFVQYRKQFLAYCLWSLFVAIPFFLFNWLVYHSVLSSYYLPQRIGSHPHFFEALAANLFSPARGLFIFSPILLFSVYGIMLKISQRRMTGFDYSMLIIPGLHWLAISSFPHWWGGHSFGPRFFSDMLPYLLYFLMPALAHILTLRGVKKICLIALFCGAIAISGWIHFRGATDWAVHSWNLEPVNVDEHPERIWDWRDIQFLRRIR